LFDRKLPLQREIGPETVRVAAGVDAHPADAMRAAQTPSLANIDGSPVGDHLQYAVRARRLV
jgi:hypothetical protein